MTKKLPEGWGGWKNWLRRGLLFPIMYRRDGAFILRRDDYVFLPSPSCWTAHMPDMTALPDDFDDPITAMKELNRQYPLEEKDDQD